MKFTLTWRPSAERKLAEIWTSALPTERDAITRAADSIDAQLANDPLEVGESRSGSVRFWPVDPLRVYYEVVEADRKVFVFAVWSQKQIPPPTGSIAP